MTDLERKTLAVAACSPTHHLTITSKLERADLMDHSRSPHEADQAATRTVHLRRGCRRGTRRWRLPPLHLLAMGVPASSDTAWGPPRILGLQVPPELNESRLTARSVGWTPSRPRPTYWGRSSRSSAAKSTLRMPSAPAPKASFLTPHRGTLAKQHPQLSAALEVTDHPTVPDKDAAVPDFMHL